jgi:DNA mismatch repair protein MutS2
MDPVTLEKLSFDAIRRLLARFARCALGRRLAEGIEPSTRPEQVTRWLDETEQMRLAIAEHGVPPFGGVTDIGNLIRSIKDVSRLEPGELAQIAATLEATGRMREWLGRLAEESESRYALILRLGERVGDFSPIAAQIHDAVDERGDVRDSASTKLRSIRTQIATATEEVKLTVQRMLRVHSVQKMLQYPNATFHNDRYVLPVKAEYQGRIDGIVHRASDTGATIYVEPAAAVQLNNKIISLQRDALEEISRILWNLTRLVRLNDTEILKTLAALGRLDLLVAKARYADSHEMTAARVDTRGVLRLREARHPILLEMAGPSPEAQLGAGLRPIDHEVVPIDVRLGDDFDLMVITGPNTGGKTVALKTVGLLAVMHQCGLCVPAATGSRMPVFDDVLIDVGDEQSLQQSLSTFSGHMKRILDVLRRADRRSLVLLDELGAGTDPEEGSAIGRAVLDDLRHTGCRAMVTTHLGALKTYAYHHDRVDNAAVEFDVKTLRPTYHLIMGEPGNSNALAICRRLGMSKRMARRADRYISTRSKDLRRAIEKTLLSRRESEEARRRAEEAHARAEQEREQLEQRQRELQMEREAHRLWIERINRLKPGDRVRVRKLDREATVVRVRLEQQKVVVDLGNMDVEVALTEIEP